MAVRVLRALPLRMAATRPCPCDRPGLNVLAPGSTWELTAIPIDSGMAAAAVAYGLGCVALHRWRRRPRGKRRAVRRPQSGRPARVIRELLASDEHPRGPAAERCAAHTRAPVIARARPASAHARRSWPSPSRCCAARRFRHRPPRTSSHACVGPSRSRPSTPSLRWSSPSKRTPGGHTTVQSAATTIKSRRGRSGGGGRHNTRWPGPAADTQTSSQPATGPRTNRIGRTSPARPPLPKHCPQPCPQILTPGQRG
jgi:hypothetical protein